KQPMPLSVVNSHLLIFFTTTWRMVKMDGAHRPNPGNRQRAIRTVLATPGLIVQTETTPIRQTCLYTLRQSPYRVQARYHSPFGTATIWNFFSITLTCG